MLTLNISLLRRNLINPICRASSTLFSNVLRNKMTRIIHFFAAKLAYIKKENYLCTGFVAISVLVCDKTKYKYIWNRLKIRLLVR